LEKTSVLIISSCKAIAVCNVRFLTLGKDISFNHFILQGHCKKGVHLSVAGHHRSVCAPPNITIARKTSVSSNVGSRELTVSYGGTLMILPAICARLWRGNTKGFCGLDFITAARG
jgi:hypothetical protein